MSKSRPEEVVFNKKKTRTSYIVDFTVLLDNREKLKESEKRIKYLDLARELRKQQNMRVTVIPIVSGTLGTISRGLEMGLEELEIRGRIETTQTKTSLK